VLAEPKCLQRGSSLGDGGLSTPHDLSPRSTPVGSLLHHVLPSPPPSRAPLGALSHRPRSGIHIIPRTPSIDVVEAALANTLVAMVDGTRPDVSVA
jgi:hypothetical protein